jgi:hypothetical protein
MACTNIQLLFPLWNYDLGTHLETVIPVALPYKVAIEYNGTTYPVFFNGVRVPTL